MIRRLLEKPILAATVAGLLVATLLSVFLLTKIVGEVISWDENDSYPSNTITVNGEGEVLAVPDIATFTFTVTETADTVEAAQNLATEKINQATTFLKDNGVEEKDIKTQAYNTYPKYEYNRPCTAFDCPPVSTPEISGYEVSQTTRVKVRQQEEAGRFLTELGSIGISNISGLSFTTDDDSVLYEQAREDAINDAKQKAEKLAQELGVDLEDVVSFGEDSPMYERGYYEGLGGAKMLDSSAAPELSRGENSYTARVWITYEID